jgi:glycerol uptake facilitator protein
LNPALTLGVAIETGDFSKLIPFLAAQMVGAFLVWLSFLPHWSRTEDPCAKLVCFSTMPAIQNLGANLLSETIGTFMLVLGVAAISSKEVAISGLWAELPVMRLIRPVTSDPV